jgi:hypothetical protein
MHDLDNHLRFGNANNGDFDNVLRADFGGALRGGPSGVVRGGEPPKRGRPREADVLIGVATCATSAMFVSLGWLLASSMSDAPKIFGVMLVLSTVAIGTLILGYVRWECGRTRQYISDAEIRLIAEVEHSLSVAANRNGRSRRLRAAHPSGREVDEPQPDCPAEDSLSVPPGLQIFLQGRDSAYPGDLPNRRFP